jgi:signal transduction histidine kinase
MEALERGAAGVADPLGAVDGGVFVSARENRPATPRTVSAARRALGPRPAVMIVAALSVVAVVSVIAALVVSSENASRSSAQQRFASGAAVRGQLTAALLSTSSTSLRSAAPKLAPTAGALKKFASASHLLYAALLSTQGRVLAISSGAPAAATQRLAGHPAYVRQALSGRAWLSDVQPGPAGGAGTLDIAVPFRSPSGRRVLVEGLPVSSLAPFLTSFLSQGTAGRAIFVVDSQRHLIAASTSAGLTTPRLPAGLASAPDLSSRTIDGSFVVSAGIANTGWKIVLAQPTSTLYPAIAGSWLLWLVVVLVGAGGLASLIPLHRSQVRAAQVVAAHAQVSALNESLEAKVAERTALAERRSQALLRSNAELEQFASVAAHDLQEPLRKIRMYAERLERRRDEVPEDMRPDLTRMDAAAGRMQNLISDLLDLARVNSRGRELVAVDLTEIAREVINDLEARISDVGATIEVDPLPVVLGDPVQMRQVLQNLFSNALKFHRPETPLHVHVSTETSGDGRCAVTVQDNGIGFDDKYAERIFGTFQRLHGRTEYEGTGIGLAIARKIAWRHDGDITATGVLGEGACFRLALPLGTASELQRTRARGPQAEPETERSAA